MKIVKNILIKPVFVQTTFENLKRIGINHWIWYTIQYNNKLTTREQKENFLKL